MPIFFEIIFNIMVKKPNHEKIIVFFSLSLFDSWFYNIPLLEICFDEALVIRI
ncbi:hypothetical protein Hanom_Chr16g01478851 [Helianthus anomalus]